MGGCEGGRAGFLEDNCHDIVTYVSLSHHLGVGIEVSIGKANQEIHWRLFCSTTKFQNSKKSASYLLSVVFGIRK